MSDQLLIYCMLDPAERLRLLADGRVLVELKRVWGDGTSHLPDVKRDRLYRRGVRPATEAEARVPRPPPARGARGRLRPAPAHARGLRLKMVDVELHGPERRVTVHFNAEDRIDFRELAFAREFHARIEMRQIIARDTTRVMDGIGRCGRQLRCSSHLKKKFEPISAPRSDPLGVEPLSASPGSVNTWVANPYAKICAARRGGVEARRRPADVNARSPAPDVASSDARWSPML